MTDPRTKITAIIAEADNQKILRVILAVTRLSFRQASNTMDQKGFSHRSFESWMRGARQLSDKKLFMIAEKLLHQKE